MPIDWLTKAKLPKGKRGVVVRKRRIGVGGFDV